MKRRAPLALLAAACGLLLLAATHARADDCGLIGTPDMRNYCKGGLIRNNDIRHLCRRDCGFIQNEDLRRYCQGNCGFIQSQDMRNHCKKDCSLIGNSDLRNACSGNCSLIGNADLRRLCASGRSWPFP